MSDCVRCGHDEHAPEVCMQPLYWGPKHDADCGCPWELCKGEDNPWPDDAPMPEGFG